MKAEILPVSINPVDFKITNKELKKLTNRIASNTLSAAKNLLQVASDLYEIKTHKLYKEDGFKSIIDYGLKIFGWKKDMIYNLLRVAENYIAENGTQTIFITENNRDIDYTVSQLQEFLSIPKETILELDKQNTISPSMTTIELRKAIKPYKETKKRNVKQSEDKEPDEPQEPQESNEQEEKTNASLRDVIDLLSESLEYVLRIKVFSSTQKSLRNCLLRPQKNLNNLLTFIGV